MYQTLIAACFLLAVTEAAHAGPRQDIFRHAKAATVLIVGIDEATHSLSLGSGFFVDASGLVVTNAHVIEGSSRLYVYVLDREIYDAPEVVAVDADVDLAVLRIPHPSADPLTLAADPTPEGTEVIAVGYPRITDILHMGFALHATSIPSTVSGLVQGPSRTNGRATDFLQTTGLLNFGNSGGPLVRSDSGEVAAMVVTTVPYLERAKDSQGIAIGSVTMKAGISYSIPAPMIRQWLAANHLSTSPSQPVLAQQPLTDAVTPKADRAFATGHLLQTMASVLHGDADLLKLAIRHYVWLPNCGRMLRGSYGTSGWRMHRSSNGIRPCRPTVRRWRWPRMIQNSSPTRPSPSSDRAGQMKRRRCSRRPSIRLIPQRRRNACTVRCAARSPASSQPSPLTWQED